LRYSFDWDTRKARQNSQKHGISFDRAANIFLDANAVSIYDLDHSEDEDRWVTLGLDSNGILLVVVHTFEQVNASLCNVRMISARKAISEEIQQYQEENP
jgi:uncharacterized DUF497 family protein